MLKVIEDDEARSLVQRHEIKDLVIGAYKAAARGEADVSRPAGMMMRGQAGTDTSYKVKGAILDALKVAGFRLKTYGSAVPAGTSSYLYVVDSENGAPLGLICEFWLHRIRTAVTGLVACQALMPKHVKRMAVLGTGRITEEFIRCVADFLPEIEIVLTSRAPDRAKASAEAWQSLTPYRLTGAPVREALADADAVVTLSDAAEVLFKASDLKPGVFFCSMGGRHEFDRDVFDAAQHFIIDEMDFVCTAGNAHYWIQSGQLSRADLERRLDATIGEVLLGQKSFDTTKQTFVIIQGMAICDLAIAKTVLDRAKR